MFRKHSRSGDDFREEIESHIDIEVERLVEEGMDPEEARHAARRAFGNVTSARERFYESRRFVWLDQFLRDVRYAGRSMWKSPGFTAAVVLTLALGIGANTAIFAVLYNVVLRPLPYPDADRLVKIYVTVDHDARGPRDISFSQPKYQDLKRANTVFDSMAAYALRSYTITAPGPAERVRGEMVSSSYFSMLGISPAMGRTFLPEADGEPGAHLVVILGDSLWRNRFGADPSVLGKNLQIDGRTFSVVGVAPAGVRGDSGYAEFWLPLSAGSSGHLTDRLRHWHETVARMKPGVRVAQASAEVRAIMRGLEEEQPSGHGTWGAGVVPLGESKIDPRLARGLGVLYAAVGFVLLIGCGNLANLTRARMAARKGEIAVRMAIGAGRGALVRQVLVENALLSVTGGIAGTALAVWSMRLLAALRPEAESGGWPSYMRQLDAQAVHMTAPVLAFGLALSLATGILFSLAPALRASRGGINEILKGGVAPGQPLQRTISFRRVLLSGQMALVVVLLVAAGLMIRSFERLTSVPLGVETTDVLTARVSLPYSKYKGNPGRQFLDRLTVQTRALPGVETVTIAATLPVTMRGTVTSVSAVDSRPIREHIGQNSVDPGFFELFRIPIRAGRAFSDRDREEPPVAILSERAARTLFPGQDPIGRRITVGDEFRIVGVAAEIHYEKQSKQLAIVGDIYMGPAKVRGGYLAVRTVRNPMSLLPEIREIVAGLDPEIPVQGARTMDQRVYLVHSYERFSTLLLGAFGALALGLAVVGIYGVFSYSVAARTREFGVRIAIGACRSDILRLVMREGLGVCLLGLGAGLPAAWAATRVISGQLHGIGHYDFSTYAVASLVLLAAGLTACYIPARRATRVDPTEVLRYE